MKIIVLSDSHGAYKPLRDIMRLNRNADIVVHCGDSQGEMDEIKREFPDKMYYMVKGNCDFGSDLPMVEYFTAEGVRFMATHGHMYNVKFGYERLAYAAEEAKVNVVLFGHTHIACDEYYDGLRLFNPGSAGYGKSFGVIEVKDGQVLTNLAHLKTKFL